MDGPVTLEQFKHSHAIDRELYVVLVKDLARDPSECLHIMGLWLWLTCTAIKNIISLPLFLINEIADEAVKCLKCINPQFPVLSEAIEIRPKYLRPPKFRFKSERSETQLTQDLLNKGISLQFLRGKQRATFHEVQNLVSDVCIPALADLFEQARHGEFRDGLARNRMMPPVRARLSPPEGRISGWNVARDRTLFVTFTRGDIVGEQELVGFLERAFGCCVELVFVQEVEPDEQPLYARVVLDGPSMMSSIVEEDNKAKYTINGKDVWIRRYVPRRNAGVLR